MPFFTAFDKEHPSEPQPVSISLKMTRREASILARLCSEYLDAAVPLFDTQVTMEGDELGVLQSYLADKFAEVGVMPIADDPAPEPAPRKMTLDEFRATRREVDDLGADLSDARWQPGKQQPGLVYTIPSRLHPQSPTLLYIESRPPEGWPNGEDVGFCLKTDPHMEYMSDDLPRLEALLYEYAIDNGYFS